jgi:hypothetical protein
MSIDIYLAGSYTEYADPQLCESGYNRLANYYNDKNLVEYWCSHEHKGKFLLDSGAYSAFKSNKTIDTDAYIHYVNEHDAGIDMFIQLDSIAKSDDGNYGGDLSASAELSWENYQYMLKHVKSKKHLLPVFHQGEPFSALRRMCEHKLNGKYIDYICLSPFGGVKAVKWLKQCYYQISFYKNKPKTHILGMLRLDDFSTMPVTSADGATWILQGRCGTLMTPFGSIPISEDRTGAKDHLNQRSQSSQKRLAAYVEEKGFRLSELATDYKKRILFNALEAGRRQETFKRKSTSMKTNSFV